MGTARARRTVRVLAAAAAGLALAACAGSPATTAVPPSTAVSPSTAGTPPPPTPPPTTTAPTTSTTLTPPATTAPSTPAPSTGATPAPSWLGRRVLAPGKDGYGAIGPTPKELDPRNIATVDTLPPPPGGAFRSTVTAVPASVVARSTWGPDCPVTLADLRYVTVSFIGFDGRAHTGELIVNQAAAPAVVRVFRALHAARFPIERMVVTTTEERDAPPTGDGNTTGSFNCRSAAGTAKWSQHAYGLAVDINPFMNPYVKGDVTLPELAGTYRDRADVRPGMITRGSPAARAFAAEGWVWGGNWTSLKDYMHFSRNGK